MMSARGDLERDLAIIERENAYEHRRQAKSLKRGIERQRLTDLADVLEKAADLREQLATLYDQLNDLDRRVKS